LLGHYKNPFKYSPLVIDRFIDTGQMFIFGVVTLVADLNDKIGQVENYAPDGIVKFDNLEYVRGSAAS
jgi:hypothetical protein